MSARLAGLVALALMVAAWPRLRSGAPRLPPATAVPLVGTGGAERARCGAGGRRRVVERSGAGRRERARGADAARGGGARTWGGTGGRGRARGPSGRVTPRGTVRRERVREQKRRACAEVGERGAAGGRGRGPRARSSQRAWRRRPVGTPPGGRTPQSTGAQQPTRARKPPRAHEADPQAESAATATRPRRRGVRPPVTAARPYAARPPSAPPSCGCPRAARRSSRPGRGR